MSGMFVKFFTCDCGQRYRMDFSSSGFYHKRNRGREDDGHWAEPWRSGTKSDPRQFTVDYATGVDKSGTGYGKPVVRETASEAGALEGGMDCSDRRHTGAIIRSDAEPRYGERYGSVTMAFIMLEQVADSIKMMIDIIKEGWKNDSRNDG